MTDRPTPGKPHLVILDTITKLRPEDRGAVAVAASHGGIYPASLALRGGVTGVIFNDASFGLDNAGVAGVALLTRYRVPAATCDYRSAAIGNGKDQYDHGIVSVVNRFGVKAGCEPGMAVSECAQLFAREDDELRFRAPPKTTEGRWLIRDGKTRVWALDSVTLTQPDLDDGHVLVTGSHGALLGTDPSSAVRSTPCGVIYNDAGNGPRGRGTSRLPILDRRRIPAATVAAASARIGEGRSSYRTGRLSVVNKRAADVGARVGMAAIDFVELLAAELQPRRCAR